MTAAARVQRDGDHREVVVEHPVDLAHLVDDPDGRVGGGHLDRDLAARQRVARGRRRVDVARVGVEVPVLRADLRPVGRAAVQGLLDVPLGDQPEAGGEGDGGQGAPPQGRSSVGHHGPLDADVPCTMDVRPRGAHRPKVDAPDRDQRRSGGRGSRSRRDGDPSAKMTPARAQEDVVETDATDDQRALLDVSSRFMEDVCPLRAVRDGAWKDDGVRRDLPPAGRRARLVLDARARGARRRQRLRQRRARRRADRLPARRPCCSPGSFVGTNVVAYALAHGRQRRRCRPTVLPALLAGEASASWAVGQRRRRPARRRRARPGRPTTAGCELTGREASRCRTSTPSSWLLVTARDARRCRRRCSSPPTPRASPSTELDSLDLTRRFAEVRFDGVRVPTPRPSSARRAPAPT